MDTTPPAGADERKLRAARRFGRIGLVITVLWLLTVPAFVVWTGLPEAAFSWPLFALYLAALGLHVWRIREHVSSLGRRASAPFMAAAAAVALAIALLGLASSWAGWIWALVSGVLLGDIVSGLRARWIVAWVAAGTAAVLGLGLLVGASVDHGVPLPLWLGPAVATFYVASMWVLDVERLWWLKAVTDLDDSRRAAAELATARERLRLADDLHDILGHALEVVAFKSELATRLLSVDGERARAEMEEV
ncbi:histidine kinase [Pseudonocardia bannensis]|uniref:Signal transduction histidine kinase subgroup 3 dimerisation and phosphoacceptor domain-containing protein n=1 Tax=Pseudonocardia bannensis TaxID=630973 RepID=A0A848DHB2_9PSEU|nr:histidine kinase [Pseudonocardia bannensis]NMH91901.1 hypothetical protein [Pseudonocardia bannensis]